MVIQGQFRIIQGHDFGTNRKRACDFLLVFNSNLGSILHRFRDMAACKNRQFEPTQSHKSPSLGVAPWEFFDESYLARQ